MMWWDGGWSWWGWLVMALVMVAFAGAVAWAAFTAIVATNRRTDDRSGESPTASAERILAERYARGELDAGEYHQRLDDLRHSRDAA